MKKNSIVYKIINNHEFRGYFLSVLSLIMTVFFFAYNLYLGINYKLVWNVSVTFYYFILLIIRLIILVSENRWKTNQENVLKRKRMILLKFVNVLFVIIDLALLVPITLMVLGMKDANIGIIPAIAVATFTIFKITNAIINFLQTKKSNNIMFHVLKTINLKEAIVSVITLQNIMIMTFGEGESMIELMSYTSAGLLLLLIGISTYQIINERKMRIIDN